MNIRFVLAICSLLPAASATGQSLPRIRVDETPPREEIVRLVPTWEIDGGENSEVVFGRIASAAPGVDGTVLLLDAQLTQVLVVSPAGEIVRVFGRPGEGPGDLPGAYRGFQLADGRIGVCGGAPMFTFRMGSSTGIALFDGADQPAGLWPVAENPRSTPMCSVRELRSTGGLVLVAMQAVETLQQGPVRVEELVLLSVPDGERTVVDRRRINLDVTDLEVDELDAFEPFAGGRCDLSRGGRVAWAPARDEWRIHLRDRDGSTQVWVRASTAARRASFRKEVVQRRFGPPETSHVADTEPVIGRIRWRPDGRLWVEPGGVEPREGAIACFDELDPDGKLLRRLHLVAPEPEPDDILVLLEDGRYILLSGTAEADGEDPAPSAANPRILLLE